MKEAVIIGAVRTPIGNFGGSLKNMPAFDLGALVLDEVAKRAGVEPSSVDGVIMGQNYQSGEYVNIARMSLLKAGWPVEIPAYTLDRRCCSGLDAVGLGAMAIKAGDANLVVAGGVESMSTAELYLSGEVRWGLGGKANMPKGHGDLALWGLPFYDRVQRSRVMSQPEERFGILPTMMTWAETAAQKHNIPREEADSWALRSHRKAVESMRSGKFDEEIVAVRVPQSKGAPILFGEDEHPRPDTSLEALSKLRPVLGGVCTAGNSSGESDGASVCIIASEEKAGELGIKPLGYLKAYAQSGADPRRAWEAVPVAVEKVFEKSGLEMGDIDLIELHEAFATQTLANLRELGIREKDYDRVNVNGSCIALGHPLGCTGARILTTLLYEMKRRGAQFGLIAICGGGGMGVSAIIERK